MAYGFKIKDSSGNVTIDSTETTFIQRDEIIKTSATSGSNTYTDCTDQEAYVIPVFNGGGSLSTGTWTSTNYGITTSVDSNDNPKVDYNIQCTNIWPGFFPNECSYIYQYHLFVFTR